MRLLLSGDGGKGLFRFLHLLLGSVTVCSYRAGKQHVQESSWGHRGQALERASPVRQAVAGLRGAALTLWRLPVGGLAMALTLREPGWLGKYCGFMALGKRVHV